MRTHVRQDLAYVELVLGFLASISVHGMFQV